MPQSHSLQRKLLALVLGALVCAWLVTTLLTWLDVRHELDELLDAHLAQSAAMLVMQQEDDHEEMLEGVDAPSLHRYAPKVAFQIFHHGHLHLHSANAPHTPMVKTFAPGFATVKIGDSAWRVFATRGREPDVEIFVGESISSRWDILWAVLRSIVLPVVGMLPLLALAIWWVIHRTIQPIRQLGTALTQRKPDALEPLSLEKIPNEVVPMVQSLNALLLRIARLIEAERRFTADASHELRTPIAAIRTQVQVAMGASCATEQQHALSQVLAGCDRAAHLTDQLLTLSRLEVAGDLSTTTVDWSQLAQEIAAGLAPKAIAKNQILELEAEQPCPVRGNVVLLGVLIRNLLDNAIRYSPPSAEIQVRVARAENTENRVLLEVEDSGAGLSDADLARLGERFFRVLGNAESGSGLGWSIVQRIAHIHQMEVTVQRSKKLGGLWVQVHGEIKPAS